MYIMYFTDNPLLLRSVTSEPKGPLSDSQSLSTHKRSHVVNGETVVVILWYDFSIQKEKNKLHQSIIYVIIFCFNPMSIFTLI